MVRKQTEIVQPVDTDNFKRCAYQSCNIFNFVDHLKYWTDKKNDEVQKFTAIVSEFPNTDFNPPPSIKINSPPLSVMLGLDVRTLKTWTFEVTWKWRRGMFEVTWKFFTCFCFLLHILTLFSKQAEHHNLDFEIQGLTQIINELKISLRTFYLRRYLVEGQGGHMDTLLNMQWIRIRKCESRLISNLVEICYTQAHRSDIVYDQKLDFALPACRL